MFLNLINVKLISLIRMASSNDEEGSRSSRSNDENKFGMIQRIDSGKSFVVGAIVGSVATAPLLAVHNLILLSDPTKNINSLAQFEYDCDSAAIIGGLFSVVYRYCIRTDTTNPQLQQGVVGAFAITRTVSRIQIPQYCTAIPLSCGAPFGIIDWNIIIQLAISGIESLILFGSVAIAIEVLTKRDFISRFPG
jgi:hypothetical protein